MFIFSFANLAGLDDGKDGPPQEKPRTFGNMMGGDDDDEDDDDDDDVSAWH